MRARGGVACSDRKCPAERPAVGQPPGPAAPQSAGVGTVNGHDHAPSCGVEPFLGVCRSGSPLDGPTPGAADARRTPVAGGPSAQPRWTRAVPTPGHRFGCVPGPGGGVGCPVGPMGGGTVGHVRCGSVAWCTLPQPFQRSGASTGTPGPSWVRAPASADTEGASTAGLGPWIRWALDRGRSGSRGRAGPGCRARPATARRRCSCTASDPPRRRP